MGNNQICEGISTMKYVLGFAAAAAFALTSASAMASGNAADGEKMFKKVCFSCHSEKAGVKKTGPSLFGIVGRKAGTVEGFKYTDANKNSGKTWDAATLDTYLKNPKAFIPGTSMVLATPGGGIAADADRANLVAFLATLK
jgi:cytochrome c